MTVYTQSNKILLNNAGEAYKTAPIIDISSSYGVTKDGSNLVSAVKNRYQFEKYRASSGSEPLENGDGFDFSSNKQISGCKFNYLQPFIFECWMKILSTHTYNIILGSWDNNNNNNAFYLGVTSNNQLHFPVRQGGTFYGGVVNLGTPPNLSNNVWYHLLIYSDMARTPLGSISAYVDGVANRASYFLTPISVQSTCKTTISGIYNRNDLRFNGKLESIKLVALKSEYLRNNTTTNAGKYMVGTQVFTPPTYPNTIL